jgi:hypothetical protein
MVSRRKFLGMLAALPAITALAGSGLLLPRRKDIEVEVADYFASDTAWYIKTEHEAGLKRFHRYSNNLSTPADLSERSLEELLKQVRDNEAFLVRPTKLIIPPRLAHMAHYVLTHKPTLFERFMWRLFPN